LDVILHIGKQKTGSTAIQHRLSALRPELKSRGFLFSEAFGGGKARYLKTLFTSKQLDADDAAKLRRFEAELASDFPVVIVSNENLFSNRRDVIQAMYTFLKSFGRNPRVYAYVRRPDEHTLSRYQQRVRTGEIAWSLETFVNRVTGKDYFQDSARLDNWKSVFGDDAVSCRLFHRETLKGGPAEDFMEWIGIPVEEMPSPPPGSSEARESLDRASIEILRFSRRLCTEYPDQFGTGFVETVRNRLRGLPKGPRLNLSAELAARIGEASRGDTEAVAASYLTEREAALLLAPTSILEDGGAVPYETISRTLGMIGDLGAALRQPTGTEELPEMPVDAGGERLLDLLRHYEAEHPDSLDDETIARAAVLLRGSTDTGSTTASKDAAEEERFSMFARLLTICDPLDAEGQQARGARRLRRLAGRQERRAKRGVPVRPRDAQDRILSPRLDTEVSDPEKRRAQMAAVAAAPVSPGTPLPPGTTPVVDVTSAFVPAAESLEDRQRRRQERRARAASAVEAAGDASTPSPERQERKRRREEPNAGSAESAEASSEKQPA
jgi:hypothetical protein